MRPTGTTANLNVPDIEEARSFYADYLGLSVEEMNLGWVARFTTPDGRAVVQLVSGDATAPVDSALSVHAGDDVEAAYEEAQRRGVRDRLSADDGAVGACAGSSCARPTAPSSTSSVTRMWPND